MCGAVRRTYFFFVGGKAERRNPVDQQRRSIRVGLAAIIFALTLKLLMGGILDKAVAVVAKPEVAAFLLYLETGIPVRRQDPTPQPTAVPEQPSLPQVTLPIRETEAPQSPGLEFSEEDAALVKLQNATRRQVDIPALLAEPWCLQPAADGPAVLILHTHATESYAQAPGYTYQASSYYRTLDNEHNMVRVGEYLAQRLEQMGISVIHDTTHHDYPAYTGSYGNARKTIQAYLQEHPSICLVLDLHRDALETERGEQKPVKLQADGVDVAQLMLVVGTDAGGLRHPDWKENLSLAAKLQVVLEKQCPGICRPINLRTERFNQDLVPGVLLVEVGAAGNTLPEALEGVEQLALALETLITAGSTS